MVSCLLNGCDVVTGAPAADTEKTPADTVKRIDISAIEFSDQFSGHSIRIHSGVRITFGGTTSLPDGTVLHSQLYENDVPLTWWPAYREYQVRNGSWQIEVLFGKNGVPEDVKPCSYYFLKIWVKDDPSIKGGMVFDTIGPPMIIPCEESDTAEEKLTLMAIMTNMCQISFSGRTQLPDGTLLNAQLFEGVNPVSWWPTDLNIEVKEGEWDITLHPDGIMLHDELSLGKVYTFTIWEKWHPSVSKTAWFDLGSMEIR